MSFIWNTLGWLSNTGLLNIIVTVGWIVFIGMLAIMPFFLIYVIVKGMSR